VGATQHFADSYAGARTAFLAAAEAAGAAVESLPHPLKGPDNEALATDVARLGPAQARKVFLAMSGTHGGEGYCGSGCQTGLLREGLATRLPRDTAVVLVHAINPHGFAHLRRVTEDNVDLNRNFVDHAKPHPANPGYAELHPHLIPTDWDEAGRAAADRGLAAFVARHGGAAYQQAVSGGQYTHADGLFFGGRAPTWSNRTLRALVARHCAGAAAVAFIDFHTGLGPRGYGEPISITDPDCPADKLTRAWFGPEVTNPMAGTSTSARVVGTVAEAFADGLAPGTAFAGLALEYGTLPLGQVLEALRGDHYLACHGTPGSAQWRELKARMRAAFYGEEAAWKTSVFTRAADFALRALDGLAQA